MHKVRLGIIGAGRIGRVHAASVSDPSVAAVPLAITDINRSAAAEVAGLFGIPQVVNDASEIFDNNDIDAVLICSSTNTHSDLICQAARARKHIFCEKPIDYDLSRIDRALEAVQKAGVK